MAGVNAPDPRTLDSWEEVFQKYSIPVVRVIERKARGNITENQERLRTLVGTSYRDLLGTSRTIIDTHQQMQQVDNLLSSIGRRCDSRLVDKIASNFATLQANNDANNASRYALASHLSVLQHALSTVSGLLHNRGSSLLAGKLLILARLAHKFLTVREDVPHVVHVLGRRLAKHRQKLLRHIDKELISPNIDVSGRAQCLAAFAIVTSSTPTDVLRHFQHLQLTALAASSSEAEDGQKSKTSVLRRLRQFVGTLRDSRSIFPDSLSSLLKALGSTPLLEDKALMETEGLNLDIHRRWLAEDIKNFKPWTRHDELTRTKASGVLKSWAGEGLEAMLEGVEKDLSQHVDVEAVLETRKEALHMWLSSRSTRLPGINSIDALARLRSCFLTRIQSLIRTTFNNFKDGICHSIEETLNTWEEKTADQQLGSLWDPSLATIDYGRGAIKFKQAVVDRFTGRDKSLHAVISSYNQGLKSIDVIKNNVEAMRSERWGDVDLFDDEFDDMDDIEDSEEPSSLSDLLSKSDPENLCTIIEERAMRTISELEKTLNTVFHNRSAALDCSDAKAQGIFVLRVLRELRKRIGHLSPSSTLICQQIVEQAHSSLALAVVNRTEADMKSSFENYAESKLVIRHLWDDRNLPLPVNPSPATFKHLRAIVKAMELLSPDLWSPSAVKKVKISISTCTLHAIRQAVETIERDASKHVNEGDETAEAEATKEGKGEAKEKSESRDSSDKIVQLLFDTQYLQHALGLQADEEEGRFQETINVLSEKMDLPSTGIARLQKSAADYWRRTYLLFGLLCTDTAATTLN